MPGKIGRFFDFLYVKQWNVGLAKMSFEDILRKGKIEGDFTWIPNPDIHTFYADPFIRHREDGRLEVIFEDFHSEQWYGRLSVALLDEQFRVQSVKQLLDTGFHLSYPFILNEGGRTYLLPENSEQGDFTCYEYSEDKQELTNPVNICENIPLLDSTIFYHDDRYWLFSTHRGNKSNEELHIYHARDWRGPYKAHKGNPHKMNKIGTRPAGQVIFHQGDIYRPTQNCDKYYGKSLIFNKITKLSETSFEEMPVLELGPPKHGKFIYGIHTINFSNDVIVIDSLARIFAPFTQLNSFLRRKWRKLTGRGKKNKPKESILLRRDTPEKYRVA